MALRNYLYAKHIHDTSIDTRINKDNSLMDVTSSSSTTSNHDQQQPPFIHKQQSRKRIVRIVHKSKPKNPNPTTLIENTSNDDSTMNDLSSNIENIHIIDETKKENCLKDCNTCDCKKDGSSSGSDTPIIEIEVDNRNNNNGNEIDFTNAI
ncbi:hypothetical protein SBY92_002480 [Candida maltosa Xu316]